MANTDGNNSHLAEAVHGRELEMFTARELESLLKIDAKTIYKYVQRGLIPYIRIQSNLRFPKQEILEWIDRHKYRPRPPTLNPAKRR